MADVTIQGIKYDEKSSFLQGAADAPPVIRAVLHNGAGNYYTENMLNLEETELDDMGDFTVHEYLDIEEVTLKNITKGTPIISLGGDHSITYPIIKAVIQTYGTIDVLHIDAHTDLYDEFEGDPYSHACPFARVMETGKVENLVQVGIRTMNSHQKKSGG